MLRLVDMDGGVFQRPEVAKHIKPGVRALWAHLLQAGAGPSSAAVLPRAAA